MQNFIKTIINAVQSWTKKEIKKTENRIVESTADWNQNDASADNYVKNRTHWSDDPVEEVIVEKQSTSDSLMFKSEFVAGQVYTVQLGNETYVCTALSLNSAGDVSLGNLDILEIGENTGEPFLIYEYTLYYGSAETTISITTTIENIHKLDSKYLDLPTNLATTDDVQEALDIASDNTNKLLTYVDTRYTLPISTKWSSVTFGDGKFVAVASNTGKNTTNSAAYSTDGINWTKATLPFNARWNSITYGDGNFVAVCTAYDDNDIAAAAYSTDGINWTKATLPKSAKWNSITYGNGKFVAVGNRTKVTDNNHVVYSTDGINWTQTTLPISVGVANITYGGGKFVAVFTNNMSSGGVGSAAYSTDGINWTLVNLPAKYDWSSVTYGNGKFVAVSNGAFIYSTDGINWTKTSSPLIRYHCTSVTYGNGKFVVITNSYQTSSNSNQAAYSVDGINWTKTTLPISTLWSSVTYGNGKFIAVSGDGGATNIGSKYTAYSTDGINWKYEPVALIQNQENKTSVMRNLLLDGYTIPAPSTAQVGQTIVVSEVDGNGKPIKWEAADAGGVGWKNVVDYTLTEGVTQIRVDADAEGKPFSLAFATFGIFIPANADNAEAATQYWLFVDSSGNSGYRSIGSLSGAKTSDRYIVGSVAALGEKTKIAQTTVASSGMFGDGTNEGLDGYFSCLRLDCKTTGNFFPAGTRVVIAGIPADGGSGE